MATSPARAGGADLEHDRQHVCSKPVGFIGQRAPAAGPGFVDTINSIKQAGEFGLALGGPKLAGLVVVISDVHALGLRTAQGLIFTTGFYWDLDEGTRAWSKRFAARTGRMPRMVQAGVHSAVAHYLKAMTAAGSDDGPNGGGEDARAAGSRFLRTGGSHPRGRALAVRHARRSEGA
jgi:hypothetical protein